MKRNIMIIMLIMGHLGTLGKSIDNIKVIKTSSSLGYQIEEYVNDRAKYWSMTIDYLNHIVAKCNGLETKTIEGHLIKCEYAIDILRLRKEY